MSVDILGSLSWFSLLADTVGLRYRCDGGLRYLIATRESFVPATVGCGAVLRGLRLVMGASEGWGGGVARNMSSFSVYVPVESIVICQRWCHIRGLETYLHQQKTDARGP